MSLIGAGYEIVKSLATLRSDFQILLGCTQAHLGEHAAASMGAPTNVNPIQLDTTDDQSIEQAAKAIEQHFGRIDVLINNASFTGQISSADDETSSLPQTTRALWQKVYDVNVIGTALVTDRLISLLQQSKAPRVIFMSSDLGTFASATQEGTAPQSNLAFSSSKTAVNMLVVQYAKKYPEITINACSPDNSGSTADKADASATAASAVQLATTAGGESGTFVDSAGTIEW